MNGSLMQLGAHGAENKHLTGNPQITFFKSVFKRHTNFAMISREQPLNGDPWFGRTFECRIDRAGDLIEGMMFKVKLPAVTCSSGSCRWVDNIGFILFDYVELRIGQVTIDKHYGEWMYIWNQLTVKNNRKGYKDLIGQQYLEPRLQGATIFSTGTSTDTDIGNLFIPSEHQLQTLKANHPATTLHVPMQFWFQDNPGLAIPLLALEHENLKLVGKIRPLTDLVIGHDNITVPSSTTDFLTCYIDYIILDSDERKKYKNECLTYLIDQVQYNGAEDFNTDSDGSKSDQELKFNFTGPCKELIWTVQNKDFINPTDVKNGADTKLNWTNYETIWLDTKLTTAGDTGSDIWDSQDKKRNYLEAARNPITSAKIRLNNVDRFVARTGKYFNKIQPLKHHSNIPENHGINVYSFALHPEESQPSGSCNMSMVSEASIIMSVDFDPSETTTVSSALSCQFKIYALRNNILRFANGRAELAYN